MIQKEWFKVSEMVTGYDIPAWQFLGFPSADSCRRWIKKGHQAGWLKPGTHFKKLYPDRQKSPIQIHISRCHNLGASKSK